MFFFTNFDLFLYRKRALSIEKYGNTQLLLTEPGLVPITL
jgi:hypothetical protein